jgi:hypothetical protein
MLSAHHITVNLLLHHQLALARRHECLKYLFKVLRHLLERPLDGFILALVEGFDEFLDTLGRLVELVSTSEVLVPLLGEGLVLVKGLFIDVLVLFERASDGVQLLEDLGVSCMAR